MLLFGQSEKYEFVSWCFRMKKKTCSKAIPGESMITWGTDLGYSITGHIFAV